MKIEKIEAFRLSIPFSEETVVPFVRHKVMQSVIVRIYAGGLVGIAETTGNPGFSGESQDGILAAYKHMAPQLIGLDPREFSILHDVMDNVLVANPAAKAGIDIACHDLTAQAYGVPVGTILGGTVHDKIQTQHLLPIKTIPEIQKDTKMLCDMGYRVFELKIPGADVEHDIAYIKAIQEVAPRDVVYIVDINKRSNVMDCVKMLRSIDTHNIYIEQPVEGVRQMAELKRKIDVPLIADELVKSLADAVQILDMGAADILSLKLVKVGGMYPAMQICSYCDSVGVRFRVDDMCMSRLGNTGSFSFARAFQNVFGCGFAQHTLLRPHADLTPVGVDIKEGWASNVNQENGVGGTIDFGKLGEPAGVWQ